MQKLTLSIQNPCNNDWDKMTSNEQGKHCSSCNKTVTDFSTYTDKELVEFFKNIPTGVCGHIPAYKLDTLLTDGTKNRNPFFKKLFWGTAIASWFGLVNKADATGTAKPSTEQVFKTKTNKDAEQQPDNAKKNLSLSFHDASSKGTIQYVNVTLIIDGAIQYYSSANGVCNISLPENAIGKTIKLAFSSSSYAEKEMELKITSLPISKKIYLSIDEKQHVMVNGGLAALPINR